ncbi:MAG: DNA alkylation repair protein [Bacteroidetes bacterium]|nr:DNA alkylation repair protein [Bacteroidota bacterium]
MTSLQLFNEIHSFCIANADEAIVKKYSRYFKDGFPGYGIDHEKYEEKVKTILSDPGTTLTLILETAPLLLKTGKYEETNFAIRLALAFPKQFNRDTFLAIENWFETSIGNWAHTDYISSELMQIFFKKGIIQYTDLTSWRTAANKFKRRAVPVSLIKQLKTTPDFNPFFTFINPMMMDPEREVHQGLGWFLREAWKKQPEPTESFLLKWKNTAARLIFQYATEKMTGEQKQRFKREKQATGIRH